MARCSMMMGAMKKPLLEMAARSAGLISGLHLGSLSEVIQSGS